MPMIVGRYRPRTIRNSRVAFGSTLTNGWTLGGVMAKSDIGNE
jgi:hypothetical protein